MPGIGFEIVSEADDGPTAVAATIRTQPDGVVMDWRMPGMDGVTATRELLTRRPETIVVAFSSADEEDVGHEFLRAGARAYIDKRDPGLLVAELRDWHQQVRQSRPGTGADRD